MSPEGSVGEGALIQVCVGWEGRGGRREEDKEEG